MPAAVPSIFAIDSNPRRRAKRARLPFWSAASSKHSGWKSRRSAMIQVLANSLVPIFVGLLFGYAAGLFKVGDNKDVKSLVTFLMTFALPSSLFVVIALTPRPLLWEQAGAAVVIAIVFLVAFVVTYYASRKLGKETAANSAVLALTLGFPNHAGIGIPLLLAVYGPKASVSVAVGLAVGAIALLLSMPLEQTRFAVLLSAIPSGFFGILFGKGFDATPEVASSSLIASTLLSIFTLAGWIVLLSHLH